MSSAGGKGRDGSGSGSEKGSDKRKRLQNRLVAPAARMSVGFSEKYIQRVLLKEYLQKNWVTTLAQSIKEREAKFNKEHEKETDVISLAFSLLKRDLGIHDFAKIIPELVMAYEREGLMDGKSNDKATLAVIGRLQVMLLQYAQAILNDYAQNQAGVLKYAREVQAGKEADQKLLPTLDKLRIAQKVQLKELREDLLAQFKLNPPKGPLQQASANANSGYSILEPSEKRTKPLPKPSPNPNPYGS